MTETKLTRKSKFTLFKSCDRLDDIFGRDFSHSIVVTNGLFPHIPKQQVPFAVQFFGVPQL